MEEFERFTFYAKCQKLFDGDITDESGVMREDAIPDASWVVADIKTWLDDRGIKYSNSATKTELLSLVDPGE